MFVSIIINHPRTIVKCDLLHFYFRQARLTINHLGASFIMHEGKYFSLTVLPASNDLFPAS